MNLGENGQFIYHYTTRRAAFEHIVPSMSLRLSQLSRLRDPVENKDWTERLLIPAQWSPADVEKLERLAASTRQTTKVLSFTLDRRLVPGVSPDHAWGYSRPRMWEQYAENHRGVCLAFARAFLDIQVLAQLRAITDDAFAGEVTYSDTPLPGNTAARSLDATRLQVKGDGDIARGLRAHLRDHVTELFFRKLEDWKTEEEFRYVLLDDDGDEVIVPAAGLRAVIVGDRFPPWQLAGASMVCDSAGVKALKISWGAVPELVDAHTS
ncbi:MAG TPA: DUF2971 domain-containing protein [Solirubrobacteraceae bacterium]|jgi:hypothetical protein